MAIRRFCLFLKTFRLSNAASGSYKMTDIYYFQEEDHENDQGNSEGSSYESTCEQDSVDTLPPVVKLERYAESEYLYNRQIVARRTVLETLRIVVDDREDVEAVLVVMTKLADDVEPSVRAELMEQVPHIAMFCQEFQDQLGSVAVTNLLPMVVKFLTDSTNQVRKTSQAALLVLLEQGLVDKNDVKEQVCPVIMRLTQPDSLDDHRTEAVALLSKMAPLIGRELTEAIFLDRFASLCTDPLFHVRKVCASNFGDFCTVVGISATENTLLPKFFYLCEDGVWGVRKACAEVFMSVSCVCSTNIRKEELSPIFINLLRDQSRWVRMAAFQALGPFISTFADPSLTALLHNDNGEIIVIDHQELAKRLEELEMDQCHPQTFSDSEKNEKSRVSDGREECYETVEKNTDLKGSSVFDEIENNGQLFNDFFFWREPVAQLSFSECSSDNNDLILRVATEPVGTDKKHESEKTDCPSPVQIPLDPALPKGPPETTQHVVPQLLIDHYVSMVDPSRAQTVDSEIARHCAFSLPAVALTLGRANWAQLRKTYENLASDMQWKVRRTLASSIHELAVILGSDATSTELIPIFNGFLKDLDEVRIGLLKHLYDFFLLLKSNDREEYLPKLSEFLKMDNDRNWRFRQELSVQLKDLVNLFSPGQVDEFISPVALFLMRDKVACVRQSAVIVIVTVIKHTVGLGESSNLCPNLLECLKESLAQDALWVHRQTYAFLCGKLYEVGALNKSDFIELVLPFLMDLADDKVPNVRISVARTFSLLAKDEMFIQQLKFIIRNDHSQIKEKQASEEKDHKFHTIEKNLRNDPDVDVRNVCDHNFSTHLHQDDLTMY